MPDRSGIIYEIADRLAPEMSTVFLQAVEAARSFLPISSIEEAIATGNRSFLAELATTIYQSGLVDSLEPLLDVFYAAIRAGGVVGGIDSGVAAGAVLDLQSPRVVAWVMEHGAGWVLGAAAETVDAIRQVVASGQLDGTPPRVQAYAIRDLVGLDPRRALAHARYVAGLHDKELPDRRIVELSDLYHHRLLSDRANTIARTESARAVLAGRYAMWEQLVDDGTFRHGQLWVEWIVTHDDRLCPYCAPMDGKRARLGVNFVADRKGYPPGLKPEAPPPRRTLQPDPWGPRRDTKGRFAKALLKARRDKGLHKITPLLWRNGTLPHPPLHPNCRCDMQLIVE